MVLRTIAGPSSERYAESAAGWRLQECVGQAEEEAEQDIEERRGERARRQVRHARSTPRRGRPSEPTALTCWVVKEITLAPPPPLSTLSLHARPGIPFFSGIHWGGGTQLPDAEDKVRLGVQVGWWDVRLIS